MEGNLGRIASNGPATIALARKVLDFNSKIDYWFQKGSPQVKKLILKIVGWSLCLKDRKLLLDFKKPFFAIAEAKDSFGGKIVC